MKKTKGGDVLCSVFIFLGAFFFFSARWYLNCFGSVSFEAVMFTLRAGTNGVQQGLIREYLLYAAVPAVLFAAAAVVFLRYRSGFGLVISRKADVSRKVTIYPISSRLSLILSAVLFVALILGAAEMSGLTLYMSTQAGSTGTLYEDEYVDPSSADIEFPERKRNLVYIYLESIETSFLSKELGGAEDSDLIPGLYGLALEGVNFSQDEGVGGWVPTYGTDWTVASMVAQTSGIPLNVPISGNSYGYFSKFMPGAVSITDILHENGYYQALMVGSDASYGGRGNYYLSHGTDRVYDIYTARKDGIVPSDYWAWWGMEDMYLYEYARQELTELSESGQPFAFTLLTADTHHVGGYVCGLCGNDYEEQYENVIACADRQVCAFVAWLKQQDFWENTTVVICGDHCSMDNEYASANIAPDYTRRVYNCILNPAVTPENVKSRDFLPFDMYPTTLAALGCTIGGDRLALGTNLFSGEATLAEKYGRDAMYEFLEQRSDYYDGYILREPS